MLASFALRRLLESGVPATVEHGRGAAPSASGSGKAIADSTAGFIKCMDNIKLGMTAVDQVTSRPAPCSLQDNLGCPSRNSTLAWPGRCSV